MKTHVETARFALPLAGLTTLALVLSVLLVPTAADAQPPTLELPGYVSQVSADDYRQRARFPQSSRPLAAGSEDPVRAERIPAPHSLPTPGSEGLLTLWSEQTSFPVGSPVELHVALTGLDRAAAARTVITGEVVDQDGQLVGTVTYRDNGQGRDSRPNDGTFAATFELPEGFQPDLAESFLVKVTATKPDGSQLFAAGGFLVSDPHAALAGAVEHRVEDGDLVLAVAVDVERQGRFHLAGTLTTLNGEPVAWAQTAQVLEPGSHTLELRYHGLIFHDRQVAGPFRVSSLALANASAMPNALAPLVEDAAVIPALPLAKLTRTPFGDPSLLEAAERLERDAANARAAASGQP